MYAEVRGAVWDIWQTASLGVPAALFNSFFFFHSFDGGWVRRDLTFGLPVPYMELARNSNTDLGILCMNLGWLQNMGDGKWFVCFRKKFESLSLLCRSIRIFKVDWVIGATSLNM